MADPDRCIPGVPRWADAVYANPAAATTFYAELFGWDSDIARGTNHENRRFRTGDG